MAVLCCGISSKTTVKPLGFAAVGMHIELVTLNIELVTLKADLIIRQALGKLHLCTIIRDNSHKKKKVENLRERMFKLVLL